MSSTQLSKKELINHQQFIFVRLKICDFNAPLCEKKTFFAAVVARYNVYKYLSEIS